MSNLKSCPDCGHTISVSARSCPSCGKHFPFEMPAPVGIAIAIGVVVMFFWSVTQPESATQQFSDAARDANAAACRSSGKTWEECR